MEELLQEHDAIVCPDSVVISLHALNGYSAKMQSALVRRWLKQTTGLSASQAQLSMLFSSVIAASDDANPKLYLGGWQVRRFQSQLHAVPKYEDISDWRASLKRGVFIELPNECGQLGIFDAESAFKFDNFDAQGNRVSVQLRKPKLDEKVSIRFDPEGVLAHPLTAGQTQAEEAVSRIWCAELDAKTDTTSILWRNSGSRCRVVCL